MKIKYVASPTTQRFSAKQSKLIAKELILIQKEVSVITPKAVVEKASDPKHPLHSYFEWNDTRAAEKYRAWQARSLILSVYIVNAEEENAQPVRAFVNVKPESDDEFVVSQGYVATTSISGRQNYQAQVLEYARQQLIIWRNKFGTYKEFFGVVQAIDSLDHKRVPHVNNSNPSTTRINRRKPAPEQTIRA